MTSYGSMPVVPGQMVMPMQPTVNPAFQPYYNSYQSSRYFKPRVNLLFFCKCTSLQLQRSFSC